MNKEKIVANVSFLLTLVSPLISFALAAKVGEADIFGVAGVVSYSWIMLCFIPIGLISLIVGSILKKRKQNYKKNFIVALICLPILFIFGSFRIFFADLVITTDTTRLESAEITASIELPSRIKIATEELGEYSLSYVKIVDGEEKKKFEKDIESDSRWVEELGTKIEQILPISIEVEVQGFDRFLFYNITTAEYNVYPTDGEHDCLLVAYDYDLQRIVILDDWTIVQT